jgi:hypothetical protein
MHNDSISQAKTSTDTGNDNMSQITLRKGFWFYFDHEGNDISVHGSAWSGKETIYFNNKEVSSSRNLTSFSGTHQFTENQNNYRVEVKVTSLIKGTVETTLFCNDQQIGKESKSYMKQQSRTAHFRDLLLGVLVGGIVGYSIMKFIF